jgi:putative membrane protein
MPFTHHGENYEWWMHGPWGFFPWPIGMLIGILFFALIIYLCFRIIQGFFSSGGSCASGESQPHSKDDNAMEILRTRYAKGEIDKEEFEQMKKDLSG